MSAYTDKASIENYLGITIDAGLDAQVSEWIAAMSAQIEKITDRVFVADASASVRLFEGGNRQKLLIDDCVEVTLVEQGDTLGETFTTIVGGDRQLLPYNGLPKNAVGLKRDTWGVGVHRITAKWGYSVTCPADIKFAATVLVAGIVNQYGGAGLVKKSETIGNYTVSYVDDKGVDDLARATAIMDSYRRISI